VSAVNLETNEGSGPPVGPDPASSTRKRRRRRGLYEPIPARHYGLIALISLLVLFFIWWFASSRGLVDNLFLPTPGQVLDSFKTWAADGTLWTDTKDSVTRILLGFFVSSLLAVPIGIMMGIYKSVEAAVEPPVDFIRYMPAVAFIPLTLIWFGTTETQKIVILFIGVFFQEVLLVMDNVKTVPKQYIEMAYTLGLSTPAVIWQVIVRYSLPGIVDTLRICMGWAWTYLVVAELVGAESGLGFRIQTAQRYLDTPLILAGIIWIGILGLMFDFAFKIIYNRSFPYMRVGR
jgi:NitT/TauT family transport system permease protein